MVLVIGVCSNGSGNGEACGDGSDHSGHVVFVTVWLVVIFLLTLGFVAMARVMVGLWLYL